MLKIVKSFPHNIELEKIYTVCSKPKQSNIYRSPLGSEYILITQKSLSKPDSSNFHTSSSFSSFKSIGPFNNEIRETPLWSGLCDSDNAPSYDCFTGNKPEGLANTVQPPSVDNFVVQMQGYTSIPPPPIPQIPMPCLHPNCPTCRRDSNQSGFPPNFPMHAAPSIFGPPSEQPWSPFGGGSTPNQFGAPPNPFGASQNPFAGMPNPFQASFSPFGASCSPFGAPPSPFGAAPSPFMAMPPPPPPPNPMNVFNSCMGQSFGQPQQQQCFPQQVFEPPVFAAPAMQQSPWGEQSSSNTSCSFADFPLAPPPFFGDCQSQSTPALKWDSFPSNTPPCPSSSSAPSCVSNSKKANSSYYMPCYYPSACPGQLSADNLELPSPPKREVPSAKMPKCMPNVVPPRKTTPPTCFPRKSTERCKRK